MSGATADRAILHLQEEKEYLDDLEMELELADEDGTVL